MSVKSTEDKEREGFPFTTRQKRRKKGGRTARKQARGVEWRKKERMKRGAKR